MSQPQPVNGNGSFTRVWANSAQENNISIGRAEVFNVQHLTYVLSDTYLGAVSEVEILGYSPTDALATGVYPIMSLPNLPSATASTDANQIALPVGAVITGVDMAVLETVTSGGSPTFDLGVGAFDTTGDNLIDGALWASFSGTTTGNGIVSVRATRSTAFSEPGTIVGQAVGAVGSNFLSLTIASAAVTGGSFVFRIRYIPPRSLVYA